jgi:hypothetical protein
MTQTNGHATGPFKLSEDESKAMDFVANVMSMRSQLLNKLFDPRRNIDDECGYPPSEATTSGGVTSIQPEFYRNLYEREPIATRVVEVLPKESWQITPMVYEDEDPNVVTPFEEAWDTLSLSLRGEQSWYVGEEGSPIWEALKRIDILSGIGHFGLLLIGIDDGKDLREPVDGVAWVSGATSAYGGAERTDTNSPEREESNGVADEDVFSGSAGTRLGGGTNDQYTGTQLSSPEYPAERDQAEGQPAQRKLLFLRAFDETLVQITQFETNPNDPRFGMPVMYQVMLNDPREQYSGIGLPIASVSIHWSRVLHVCDHGHTAGSSEVFAVPRMRPVLNRLLDLRKIYAGSAEGYWRAGCMPTTVLETIPQLGGDVKVDMTALRDMMEDVQNGLQKWYALMGMSAKTLAPTVVDPTSQVNVQTEAICIKIGCPIRVFKGSERGELASSQDDAAWNDRLRERQNNYITPRLIVPLIDRLIAMGVLPEPKGKKQEGKMKAGISPYKPAPKAKAPEGGQEGAPPGGGGAFGGASGGSPFSNNTAKVRLSNGRTIVANNVEMLGPTRARVTDLMGRTYIINQVGRIVGIQTKGGYSIEWPDLDSLGDAAKMGIALQETQALAAYVSGGIEAMIPPMDYLTAVLGMSDEQAGAIIDNATKAHEAEETMTIPPQVAGRDVAAPEGTQDFDDAQAKQEQFDKMAEIKGKQAEKGIAPGGEEDEGRDLYAEGEQTENSTTVNADENCGVGAGGFQPGNTCGAGKKMAGFVSAPGVASVKKSKDFEYTGTYVVKLDNGDEHHIFFDRQSSAYWQANHIAPGDVTGYLGSVKSEVLGRLVAKADKLTPHKRGGE